MSSTDERDVIDDGWNSGLIARNGQTNTEQTDQTGGTGSLISPLRYPGAKRRLAGYVADVLQANGLRPKLFVEPFAGGAGVALYLLEKGLVDSIGLGERDPMVASFWKVAFEDTEWFVRQIGKLEISLDKWRYYKNARLRSDRSRALACLFLNRTSFSGILSASAGPLGGYRQVSEYKIDCRFNADAIARRITQLAAYRDRVKFILNDDWQKTLAKVCATEHAPNDVFVYLDPPFYKKADRLYRYYFSEEDHELLCSKLKDLTQPWLLSYDPAKEIIDLYSRNGHRPRRIGILYSIVSKRGMREAEELMITNLDKLPEASSNWQSRTRISEEQLDGDDDR